MPIPDEAIHRIDIFLSTLWFIFISFMTFHHLCYGNESTYAEKKSIPRIASSGKDTFWHCMYVYICQKYIFPFLQYLLINNPFAIQSVRCLTFIGFFHSAGSCVSTYFFLLLLEMVCKIVSSIFWWDVSSKKHVELASYRNPSNIAVFQRTGQVSNA